ncbi:hypothetical protein BD769DRAFT_1037126 [Suillus cothurnatus]|jgi:protein-S-isoprenylcysteine O-methyltransferase Ste14|nr:hypothetical protein BD769DRAFT_1037126 [Suillus cothurnatus]
MSLAKIPFIIASAISVHISFFSAAPPPKDEEKMAPNVFESFVLLFQKLWGNDIKKFATWTATIVEVASILALNIDPSLIPDIGAMQFLRALRPTSITPAFLAGSLAVIIGGAFRRYCVLTLGKCWSWPLSIRKEHRLVTEGPYSIVRHPSYTGYLIQYIGVLIMYGEQGSWLRQSGFLQVPYVKLIAGAGFYAFTVGACLAATRPPIEDKMLQRALGQDWDNWAKRVQYRLIPGIY